MNIHEYQAKQILKEFKVPVLDGRPVFTEAEAENAANSIPGPIWVVRHKYTLEAAAKGHFVGRLLVKMVGLE